MYEGLDKDDVHNLTIEHTPQPEISLNHSHLAVKLKAEEFLNCKDLQYELQCKQAESEEYKSVLNFTEPEVSVEEYKGLECRVR